jgi:hypothetical protein
MSPGKCPATSSRPAPPRSSMASRQRPTGPNLRTRLSTVAVVSLKSGQQDVQQQGRTTARMHDRRQRPLAAVVVPTWHAPGLHPDGWPRWAFVGSAASGVDLANEVAHNESGRARTRLELPSPRRACQQAAWTTTVVSGRTLSCYGSDDWGFESLRARHRIRRSSPNMGPAARPGLWRRAPGGIGLHTVGQSGCRTITLLHIDPLRPRVIRAAGNWAGQLPVHCELAYTMVGENTSMPGWFGRLMPLTISICQPAPGGRSEGWKIRTLGARWTGAISIATP